MSCRGRQRVRSKGSMGPGLGSGSPEGRGLGKSTLMIENGGAGGWGEIWLGTRGALLKAAGALCKVGIGEPAWLQQVGLVTVVQNSGMRTHFLVGLLILLLPCAMRARIVSLKGSSATEPAPELVESCISVAAMTPVSACMLEPVSNKAGGLERGCRLRLCKNVQCRIGQVGGERLTLFVAVLSRHCDVFLGY